MSQYKALIFDLGKVVFDVSFGFAFDRWAVHAGMEQQQVKKKFRFDEFYGRFERDEISPEEYAAHVSSLIGFSLSNEQFEEGWNNIYLDEFPGIKKLLAALQKNYRLIALTNTNRIHAKIWPVRYADALSYFETIFSSYELKMRKPEICFYETAINSLGISANEIIFLDDRQENIIAAEATGMKGILVRSTSQMIEALGQNGIYYQ